MTAPDPSSANAFDQAAKSALRSDSLRALPAWLDSQIVSAAHTHAHGKQMRVRRDPHVWWHAPWLKFALPSVAVGTVLLSIWLPHTEITRDSIQLPQAAHLPVPAPAAPTTQTTQEQQLPAAAPPKEPGSPAANATSSTPALKPERRSSMPQPAALHKPQPQPQMHARAALPAPSTQASKLAAAQPSAYDAAKSTPQPAPAAAPIPSPVPAPAESEVFLAEAQGKNKERVRLTTPPAQADEHANTTQSSAAATQGVVTTQTHRRAVPAPTTASALAAAQHKTDGATLQAQFEAIRKLLAHDQLDAARKNLLALLKRDAGLQVPEDLKILLPKP